MLSLPYPEPADPDAALHARARALLDRFEVRVFEIDGCPVVGIWSDYDSPAVRAAIRAVGWGHLPLRYRDSPDFPDKWKVSSLPGEPVPLEILRNMENAMDGEPWKVLQQKLLEWDRRRAQAKAAPPPELEPEPEIDWRSVQRGFAIYAHWRRWIPARADEHRARHADDELAWLLELASQGKSMKTTLDRLEYELERACAILANQPDRENANRRFVDDFRSQLERLRERCAAWDGDPLIYSHHELDKFVPTLQRLAREIEGDGTLSLFA